MKRDKAEVSSESHRTYAEQLLSGAVAEAEPCVGPVLVAGNRSGWLVAELAERCPEAQITAHAFDCHHTRAIRDRLVEAQRTARVAVIAEAGVKPEAAAAPYARAYFMTTPRSMPAELVLDQLQDIFLNLAEGGEFWAAFEGDADEALRTMKLVWPNVHVVTRTKHAVLFRAVKRGTLKKVRSFASDWQASVPGGEPLTFTSLPGCFCHRRPDAGGLALAETGARLALEGALPEGGRILDMGCGCGLVGLLVADAVRRARGAAPGLTLIDSHARALAAARLNAARADLAAEFILADDGLPRGRAGEFDLFLGNPPYYSDYRIAEVFLETAYRALRPGGVCLSVVKTASGLQSLQDKYFRSSEIISRRGYCVLRSVRL